MALLYHARRVKQIPSVAVNSSGSALLSSYRFISGSRSLNNRVNFGDVNIELKGLASPHSALIPNGSVDLHFGPDGLKTREIFGHLRWIAQKYALNQDMYLCGHPGPLRRNLAMSFADLCGLEVEYVTISRDTTESDLKQRKEIVGDSVLYFDQAPVRAAINGRLLILDGLENAERNVLPTLNNLLENREMNLDDGRFLTARTDISSASNLVKVHPNFRIIALGLPVPPYQGKPMDPPLRSRFQSRFIDELKVDTLLEINAISDIISRSQTGRGSLTKGLGKAGELDPSIQSIFDFYETLRRIRKSAVSDGRSLSGMPVFSINNVISSLKLVTSNSLASSPPIDAISKRVSAAEAIGRVSPGTMGLISHLSPKFEPEISKVMESIRKRDEMYYRKESGSGDNVSAAGKSSPRAIQLFEFQNNVLKNMMLDHKQGDHICILGPKGCGKSFIANEFAKEFNYKVQLFPLFSELTSRDLLQRRCTLDTVPESTNEGSIASNSKDTNKNNSIKTSWQDSPLIHAARNGHLCILDGINRIDNESLAVITRLLQSGEIDLPNGERLSRTSPNLSSRIHPDFRVLALGLNPTFAEDATARYICNSTGFSYHVITSTAALPAGGSKTSNSDLGAHSAADSIGKRLMRSFDSATPIASSETEFNIAHILPKFTPDFPKSCLPELPQAIMAIHQLGLSEYSEFRFSIRQLVRLKNKLANLNLQNSTQDKLKLNNEIFTILENLFLVKFLPSNNRDRFYTVLKSSGYSSATANSGAAAAMRTDGNDISVLMTESNLTIGNITVPRRQSRNPEKVPNPLFYENAYHTNILKDLLSGFAFTSNNSRSILVIGNQGVGKNKVTDRLLHLLNTEREYTQLNRDTTLQSLLVNVIVENNKIKFIDSPLVVAMKTGRVAIIDEADKADNSVVCILKSMADLISASSSSENNNISELVLFDNRRLVTEEVFKKLQSTSGDSVIDPEKYIVIHKDFRMIVLANQPGFPFLGNNFFRECGDVFDTTIIDNLDYNSEFRLLKSFTSNFNASSSAAGDNSPSGSQTYAPIDDDILHKITLAFSKLREEYTASNNSGVSALNGSNTAANTQDNGIPLRYPFSAREAVSIIKHLTQYPNDSFTAVASNILAFDTLNPLMMKKISAIFQQSGLPLHIRSRTDSNDDSSLSYNDYDSDFDVSEYIRLSERFKISPPTSVQMSDVYSLQKSGYEYFHLDSFQQPIKSLSYKSNNLNSASLTNIKYSLDKSVRLDKFTEEICRLNVAGVNEKERNTINMHHSSSTNIISDMLYSPSNNSLFVLTSAPYELLIYKNFINDTTFNNPGNTPTASFNSKGETTVDRIPLVDPDVMKLFSGGVDSFISELRGPGGSATSKVVIMAPELQMGFVVNLDTSSPQQGKSSMPTVSSFSLILKKKDDSLVQNIATKLFSSSKPQNPSNSSNSNNSKSKKKFKTSKLTSTNSSESSRGMDRMILFQQGDKLFNLFDFESNEVDTIDLSEALCYYGNAPIPSTGTTDDNFGIDSISDGVISGSICLFDIVDYKGNLVEVEIDLMKRSRDSGNPAIKTRRRTSALGEPLSVDRFRLQRNVRDIDSESNNSRISDNDRASIAYFGGTSTHYGSEIIAQSNEALLWGRENSTDKIFGCLYLDRQQKKVIVNSLSSSITKPFDLTMPADNQRGASNDLEIVDLTNNSVIILDVSRNNDNSKRQGSSRHKLTSLVPTCLVPLTCAGGSNPSGLLAVGYNDGLVRIFETNEESLSASSSSWKRLFGSQQHKYDTSISSSRFNKDAKQAIENTSIPKTGLNSPKFGKIDENMEQHVGGNTWAGGSGGSDTAGLGGRGGPYRLQGKDKDGNPFDVHQISDEKKNEVSEETRRRARAMAQEALEKRLEDIHMGKADFEMYELYRSKVLGEINQLRLILDEFSRRAQERIWLRNQSFGDLDDGKLVDGMTGERMIFKRRGYPNDSKRMGMSNSSSNSEVKKKRIQFVVDCSGSMYRFNGADRRLERLLEAVLLVLEAMPSGSVNGADKRSGNSAPSGSSIDINNLLEYSITGHSGDSPCIPFLDFHEPKPSNEADRLRILQEMAAHTQYTYAGDHTLEAMAGAIKNIAKDGGSPDSESGAGGTNSSQNFVFVVSDANFRRYGISPNDVALIMKKDPSVSVHLILIASLREEASQIQKALPRGRCHLAYESTALTSIFRQILTESGGVLDIDN